MQLSAVIDLGTNTFRLLVAQVTEGGIKQVYSENQIARLGEGFSERKCFLPVAMERAIKILLSFKERLDQYPVDLLSVVGTSAFREAENRDAFLLSIREKTGFSVEVISGEEEAYFTFLGANLILCNTGRTLLIDIGGGSTELILAEGETPIKMISTALGVVSLTERYLRHDPTTRAACHPLQQEIKKILVPFVLDIPQDTLFAGTAGTLTTLAAMAQEMARYDPEKINGYRLSKSVIDGLLTQLLPLSAEERCRIPGLEKGREDLILSGIMILLTLMELCHFESVTVIDYGLREGILIDHDRKKKIGHLVARHATRPS